MTIRNKMKILIAQKELREGRKLPYRVISQETGLSTSTLVAYSNQSINQFASVTLEALCAYFDCQVGDLLEYVPQNQQ